MSVLLRKTLSAFGKHKYFVNTFFLPKQLRKIVKKIEFEKYKKNNKFPGCECEIRFKFDLEPKSEFLKRLGCNFDGYYIYYIYNCQICEFGWMIKEDEESGIGTYQIWDKASYPINNKNCS